MGDIKIRPGLYWSICCNENDC